MPFDPKIALYACQKASAAYFYPTYTPGCAKFILETVNGVQYFIPAGTCDLGNVLEDADAILVERVGIGSICKGDADYWSLCEPILLAYLSPDLPVACYGHSLAGSVSAIASLELKNRGFKVLDCYTFGAKRTGDGAWETAWNNSGLNCYRLVVRRDPIPMLEGWLPHIGTEIAMGSEGIPLIEFHNIDTSYLPNVEQLYH